MGKDIDPKGWAYVELIDTFHDTFSKCTSRNGKVVQIIFILTLLSRS